MSNLIGVSKESLTPHHPEAVTVTASSPILLAIESTGLPPNNSKQAHDVEFEHIDKSVLIEMLQGFAVIPYDTPEAEDVLLALAMAGWQLRYDVTDHTLHARHPSRGEEWLSCHPKKNPALCASLAETCNRLMVEIREVKRGKSSVYIASKPKIKRCAGAGAYTLHDELLGLAAGTGSPIPHVHPFTAYFEILRDFAEAMSPEEQAEAMRVSIDWLIDAPYLSWPFPHLARAAGANITAGLVMRLAEAKYRLSPFMQKKVVHIAGAPDTGKTGLLRALCPPMLARFAVGDYSLASDINRSQEKLIGRHLVVMDDFSGGLPREIRVNQFNGFITAENPHIDVKYQAPRTYPRTAWLTATGITLRCSKRGDTDGDVQAFYRRFLVAPCSIAPDAEGMEISERVGAIRGYVERISMQALAGGYLRWRAFSDAKTGRVTDALSLGIETPRSLEAMSQQAIESIQLSDPTNPASIAGLATTDAILDYVEGQGLAAFTKDDYATMAGWRGSSISLFARFGAGIEATLANRGWVFKTNPTRRFEKIG